MNSLRKTCREISDAIASGIAVGRRTDSGIVLPIRGKILGRVCLEQLTSLHAVRVSIAFCPLYLTSYSLNARTISRDVATLVVGPGGYIDSSGVPVGLPIVVEKVLSCLTALEDVGEPGEWLRYLLRSTKRLVGVESEDVSVTTVVERCPNLHVAMAIASGAAIALGPVVGGRCLSHVAVWEPQNDWEWAVRNEARLFLLYLKEGLDKFMSKISENAEKRSTSSYIERNVD